MTVGRLGRTAAALSVAGLAVLGFQAPAVAQPADPPGRGPGCPNPGGNYPPGRCDRGVTDSTVAPGQTVVFSSGSDFCPGSSATFRAPGVADQSIAADSTGNVSASYTAPSSVRPGRYESTFTCVLNAAFTRIPFTVVAATAQGRTGTLPRTGALPRTGSNNLPELTAAGAGLVAIGGLTVAAARRRRDDAAPV